MSKDEYLITDAPLKALTVFAMPMILGSFFQQIYNMADSIIVGQFVGSSALAAVGACAALTNVFICVALGAGVGAGVLVSRYFGAREYGKMKTIVSTSLFSFLILSIVLGIFGFCFSHWMMSALQTPADIQDDAVLYLRVYFVGFPFLFMYNILSTMFTSIGESKIPLTLLIFSSILNIFMDLWMVAGLGLGVFGAALATLIAQGISAVLSFLIFFFRMRRYNSPFRRFDCHELRSMLRIAVPSVLQQTTVAIGMMIVQAVVNPFGTQALAGYAATMRIENVFSLIFVSIGNAVSPYVSQNLGANKPRRIKKDTKPHWYWMCALQYLLSSSSKHCIRKFPRYFSARTEQLLPIRYPEIICDGLVGSSSLWESKWQPMESFAVWESCGHSSWQTW